MRTPSIGSMVLFQFESSAERRTLSPALVMACDGYGANAKLMIVLVDATATYDDEARGPIGTLTILHGVPYVETVRDSVDGSVMAACWMEFS